MRFFYPHKTNYLQIVTFILFLIFCFNNSYVVKAQVTDNHLSREVKNLFDKAKSLQNAGEYKKANLVYREMLNLNKMLPPEFAFFFAITLYHTKQYHNAKTFVQKYIDLLKEKGDYYKEAIELELKIKTNLSAIANCQLCDKFGYKYKTCHVCHGKGTQVNTCYLCKGVGTITCPKCKGEGVEIVKNSMQIYEYKVCSRCNLKRQITCPVCNKAKVLTQTCELCLGSGREVTQQLCEHIP